MTASEAVPLGHAVDAIDALLGDLTTIPLTSLSPAMADLVGPSKERRVEALHLLEHTDPRLVFRALQIANAAFFGTSRRIRNMPEAAELVGAPLVSGLLIAAEVFLAFEGVSCSRLSTEQFESYSIRVARLAHRFGDPIGIGPDCFLGAALHEVGRLVLASRRPVEFSEAVDLAFESGCSQVDAEQKILGMDHPTVGGRLLQHWGLAPALVQTVLFHHEPRRGSGPAELMACVHGAYALLGIAACRDPESTLDVAFIEGTSLGSSLPAWRVAANDEATRALHRAGSATVSLDRHRYAKAT